MKKRLLICCALALGLFWLLPAQNGFHLPPGRRQVDIPFEYSNNFIILTLHFNGFLPLKFIFDTGAEHTVLTKREISDLMKVPYEREFQITGSDLTTPLVAYLARRIRFDIPEKAVAPSEDILVLQEDYFRFEEYAGIEVHGILSANAFSRYVIKINYQRRIITLYDRDYFRPPGNDYLAIPLEIYRNKPYVNTTLQVLPDSAAAVKLLLDTGAGMSLLLFTDTHPLLHPPDNALASNIGMGLGGYLEGFAGRVFRLELGQFSQQSIVTFFQQIDTTVNYEYLNKRNGLLGNGLLSRFSLIIDYQKQQLWLKPTKNYQAEYVFDRSGMSIIASGPKLDVFIVQNVLPNSPALEADIRPGDQILRVGTTPSVFLTLPDIQRKLLGKPGKKVNITLRRDGEKIKKTVVLRDML
ncbi:MAG: aspartyl protease family protein [Saprospiraceae bacterium]|nr:aspartyl protease family protein [Saprospiraceae bacterium]